MLTPTAELYANLVLLIMTMLLLVLVTVRMRRNEQGERDLAERIGRFLDEELDVILHFRHVTQDLVRIAPERAEILEVVDLELARRHETLSDARTGLAFVAAGKTTAARRNFRLLRKKYPGVF
jgi:hypothetical protein